MASDNEGQVGTTLTSNEKHPTAILYGDMNNPDGTPGRLDLPNAERVKVNIDTSEPFGQDPDSDAVHGKFIMTAPTSAAVTVAANMNGISSITRLPGSNETRIRTDTPYNASLNSGNREDITAARLNFTIQGPEEVSIDLDNEDHGTNPITGELISTGKGFVSPTTPVSVNTTIDSNVRDQSPRFTTQNDKAEYAIGDKANASMDVDMGTGYDTLTLRAKDGKLVSLGGDNYQFIRESNGNRFVMDIKNVENINLVFDSAPATTPASATPSKAPAREGEGR